MRKRGAERAMSMGTSRACWKGTDWMGTGETPPAEGSHSSSGPDSQQGGEPGRLRSTGQLLYVRHGHRSYCKVAHLILFNPLGPFDTTLKQMST